MNELIMKGRILRAAKTDAEWIALNPILKRGEKVYVITDEKSFTLGYKIGDGTTPYTNLGFSLTQGEGIVSYAPNSVNIGYYTQVGTLGYRIIDFHCNKEGVTSTTTDIVLIDEGGTYTLDLADGESLPQDLVGNTYSIHLRAAQEMAGTITAVDGNTISVTPFFYPSKWDHSDVIPIRDEYFASSYLFCNELPNIGNITIGSVAFAEGYRSKALQVASHSEGNATTAAGKYAHTEGDTTFAGYAAHAQNKLTRATGYHSHAQNYQTEAKGWNSSASGEKSRALGKNSDAGGCKTIAEGANSFTRGFETEAPYDNSVALNRKTIAGQRHQTVVGELNEVDEDALFVVGDGNITNNIETRSNAMVVYRGGRVKIGQAQNSNEAVTLGQLQSTTQLINNIIPSTNNIGNPFVYDSGTTNWFQIATTPRGVGTCSSIFKIKANTTTGGIWTSAIIIAEIAFDQRASNSSSLEKTKPKLTILSCNHRAGKALDAIRIVYNDGDYSSSIASLQVHCCALNKNVQIFVEQIDDWNNIPDVNAYQYMWHLADYSKEYNLQPASADLPLQNAAVAKGPKTLEKTLDSWSLSDLNIPNIDAWHTVQSITDASVHGYIDIKLTDATYGVIQVLFVHEHDGSMSAGGMYMSYSINNGSHLPEYDIYNNWGLMNDIEINAIYNDSITISVPYNDDGIGRATVKIKFLDGGINPSISLSYRDIE